MTGGGSLLPTSRGPWWGTVDAEGGAEHPIMISSDLKSKCFQREGCTTDLAEDGVTVVVVVELPCWDRHGGAILQRSDLQKGRLEGCVAFV